MPPASTRDSIQAMSLTIVIHKSSGWPLVFIHKSLCSNWNNQNLLTVSNAEFLEVSYNQISFSFSIFHYSQKDCYWRLQTCKCHVVHWNWKVKGITKYERWIISRSYQNYRISSNVPYQVYHLRRMGWFLKCA